MSKPQLRIDIDKVLRQRLGHRQRWLPKWLTTLLAKTIRQDDLNGILRRTSGKEGAEFCEAVLNDLEVTYTTSGPLPDPTRRNVIIISNHPLGALDGITLIDWATRHFGHNVKFLVNDLLMAIDPLRPVFVPVNKFGRQDRQSARTLDKILCDNDTPLLIFPAGLCSRKLRGGIADLPWKKTFISRAVNSHRDIIPLFFQARNSTFFYNFANFRQRLLPKVNIEMALLPREIFNSRGRQFTLHFGNPIPWDTLTGIRDATSKADDIRKMVYALDPRQATKRIEQKKRNGTENN